MDTPDEPTPYYKKLKEAVEGIKYFQTFCNYSDNDQKLKTARLVHEMRI